MHYDFLLCSLHIFAYTFVYDFNAWTFYLRLRVLILLMYVVIHTRSKGLSPGFRLVAVALPLSLVGMFRFP